MAIQIADSLAQQACWSAKMGSLSPTADTVLDITWHGSWHGHSTPFHGAVLAQFKMHVFLQLIGPSALKWRWAIRHGIGVGLGSSTLPQQGWKFMEVPGCKHCKPAKKGQMNRQELYRIMGFFEFSMFFNRHLHIFARRMRKSISGKREKFRTCESVRIFSVESGRA